MRLSGNLSAKAFVCLFSFLLIPGVSASERPKDIVGVASVIDGDTIEIHGTRIRLHAIDAPEGRQLCKDEVGKDYRCGQHAALALADLIDRKTVYCSSHYFDRYRRVVATCRLGKININEWLVAEGHALAYRRYGKAYVSAEEQAKINQRGMWKGTFVPPWDWRRKKRK